jgi:hypothetical protein
LINSYFPGGCAGVKTTGKGAVDKEYFIQIKGKCEAFASVYCHGMNTNSPQDYISLRTGPLHNFARIFNYKQPEIAKYECERQNGMYIFLLVIYNIIIVVIVVIIIIIIIIIVIITI